MLPRHEVSFMVSQWGEGLAHRCLDRCVFAIAVVTYRKLR